MWQPGVTLVDIEREVIFMALKFYQGNRTHTAQALGIAHRTLQNKIDQYRKLGLEVPAAPEPQPREACA